MKKLVYIFLFCLLASCSETPAPKPRGFFRIDMPEKKYTLFTDTSCPYRFETPQYSYVLPDTNRFAEPCWKYILYPKFGAQLYLTYKPLKNNLAQMAEDSRGFAYKHTIKANGIDENVVKTQNNVYGVVYDIGGNAASNMQLYVTDSLRHFLRGSLYFNAIPNADSLRPSLEFIRKDVLHLINTLQWSN